MDQQIRIQKAKQKHTERCQCNQRYNSTVWSGNNQDKFSKGTAFQLLKQGYLKSDTGIFLFPTTNNSAKNKILLRNFGIFIAIATTSIGNANTTIATLDKTKSINLLIKRLYILAYIPRFKSKRA